MGIAYNPTIVTNGLVLALDAGNQKSLNIPTQADHGYAEWYCIISGTATYSIINPTGGIIYERNGSTVTPVVTASGPQRGTISITAGRFYYGSVPINIIVEDRHHWIAPLTMMGTQFWNIAVRNNPSTYYVYSPYQSATVNFYDNTVGGLTGTPTSTLSLSAGQSPGTFTSNNLTNHWISSNVPVLVTATQNEWDKTILSPMSTYVYYRYSQYLNTTNNTTPTNNNSYVTYDSTYKVMNMSIGDGSGGDCAQGLGLEYLSDTYSWGNVVSDYTIVFPYTATVTTSYWNGSTWVVWDTHTNIAGSITNPPRVTRDGTNGPGVEAGAIQGAAANMASGATLWKWEGTAPFYLCINDSADDEFSVLGWLSARNTTPRSSNIITDITGRGNNGTLTNGPVFTLGNGGSLSFDGTDDNVLGTIPSSTFSGAHTICCWFYRRTVTEWSGLFSNNVNTTSCSIFTFIGTSNFLGANQAGVNGTAIAVDLGADHLNKWIYAVITYAGSTNGSVVNVYAYKDGSLLTATGSLYWNLSTSSSYYVGRHWAAALQILNGFIPQVSIYNRALTAAEIQQNFNATRGRYGV